MNHRTDRRRVLLAGLAGLGATALSLPRLARAATPYPGERAITFICPWPAGGTADVTMRALCMGASKALGQTIANYDAGITKPVVKSLYHWLMVTSTDESIKGDYVPRALGFKAFSDKVTRRNTILSALTFAMSATIFQAQTDISGLYRELYEINGIERFLLPDAQVEKNAAILAEQLREPPSGEEGLRAVQ